METIEDNVESEPLGSKELALEPVFAHIDRLMPSVLSAASLKMRDVMYPKERRPGPARQNEREATWLKVKKGEKRER